MHIGKRSNYKTKKLQFVQKYKFKIQNGRQESKNKKKNYHVYLVDTTALRYYSVYERVITKWHDTVIKGILRIKIVIYVQNGR